MAESDEGLAELPLDGAGTRLRRAREAAGLKLSDIAARTRISERHLVSIENGNFAAMASRAYAVGFARSYARTLGLDEQVTAQAVRDEMDGQEPNADRYQPATYEPGDPARVPSARIAWVAALGALAVVLAGYLLWRSFYAPAMSLPAPTAEAGATQAPAGTAINGNAAALLAGPPATGPATAATVSAPPSAVVPASRASPQARAAAPRDRVSPPAAASATAAAPLPSPAATAGGATPNPAAPATPQSSTVSQ